MKQNYAAKRREHLRRVAELRRNTAFAVISLLAHAILLVLLPSMAAPRPVVQTLFVELKAQPRAVLEVPPPVPVIPAADDTLVPPSATSPNQAQTTPAPKPVKQSSPSAPAVAAKPQAPKAPNAKPGVKAAPAQSAPGNNAADVKLTPAQPAKPVAPKSEEKAPVESKPAEKQGAPNPAPQPKGDPKAEPSAGDKPAAAPASAPPVKMPKDGPPAAPPSKNPGAGDKPAEPSGPQGPDTAAPSAPPGPSKQELSLLSAYGDVARKRIKSQARNPEAGGGGTVKLEFTVAKSGRLVDVKLVESSGYKLLDNDALEATEVAFNEKHEIIPFPKDVKVEQWTFFMALKYPLW
jgi:periplasmic protein TonB